MSSKEPRLMEAQVKGLFEEYDHSISLSPKEHFAIIYGPNGVGKTKFLEIIHALSHLDGLKLSFLPFKSAVLHYSNDAELTAELQPNKESESSPEAWDHQDYSGQDVLFKLKLPKGKSESWKFESFNVTRLLRRFNIEPTAEGLYRLPYDGEIMSFEQVMKFVAQEYSPRLKAETWEAPASAKAFTEKASSFLIETQRLKIEQTPTRRLRPPRSSLDLHHSTLRITEQSNLIVERLQVAQTAHSIITQQLDKTFPSRVLQNSGNPNVSEETIRNRYDEQNKLRSRIGRVVSADLAPDLELPEVDLSPWHLKLLDLYLEDTDKKLTPFDEVLKKIELLERIINSRLLNKRLQVTAGKGISVEHLKRQQSIPLDRLSSGEQHEIILMTDLLFNVPPGALVLIDEPEISLHVAWQLSFIPDVKRISELVGFKFIVATHSPQIVNGEWEHTIRLEASKAVSDA